jgi:hypothetical protein
MANGNLGDVVGLRSETVRNLLSVQGELRHNERIATFKYQNNSVPWIGAAGEEK